MTGGDVLLHERFVKKAITIKEVSEKTNISKERISAIECNKTLPTWEELFNLNNFFGLRLKMNDFHVIPVEKMNITSGQVNHFFDKRKRH